MIGTAVDIGIGALAGLLAGGIWILWAVGGHRNALPQIWPAFHIRWATWPTARKFMRLGLVVSFYLVVVATMALLSRLAGLAHRGGQVAGFALFIFLYQAAILVSSPLVQQRKGGSGGWFWR